MRSPGTNAKPEAIACRASRSATTRPSTSMRPVASAARPNSAPNRSERPAPTRPAKPTTSPGATSKLTPRTRPGTVRSVTRSAASSTLVRRAVESQRLELAPDHQVDQRPLVEVADRAVADDDAVAQDGDPARDGEDLVEAVRDEDDGHAVRCESANGGEEQLDLVVRERARRLVENEHARIRRERPRDLDELLHVRAQPPGRRVQAHVALERAQQRRRPLARRAPVDPEPRPRLARPEEDVLRHGKGRNERRLLRHRGDSGGERLCGVAEAHLAAVEQQAPLVGHELRRHDLRAASTCRSRSRRRARAPRPRGDRGWLRRVRAHRRNASASPRREGRESREQPTGVRRGADEAAPPQRVATAAARLPRS